LGLFDSLGCQIDSENWFTNCLAFFLRLDHSVAVEIVSCLTGRDREVIEKLGPLAVTQYRRFPENNRISDVVLEDNNKKFFLLIEDKVGDPVDIPQLRAYEEYQIRPRLRAGKDAFLALLTEQDEHKKVEQFAGRNYFKHTRWLDIYRTLADFEPRNPNTKSYIGMFLQYLDAKRMSPPAGFTRDYGKAWLRYVDFSTNAYSILGAIKPLTETVPPFYVSEGPSESVSEGVPYIGYYLYFKALDEKQKSKFQVWLGFAQEEGAPIVADIELYFEPPQKYYQDVVIQKYGERLERWASKLKGFGWSIDLDDAGPAWREQALTEIIGKSTRFEDQRKKILNYFLRGLQEIRKAGTLELIKRTLRSYS
jgi:hypothetical protein